MTPPRVSTPEQFEEFHWPDWLVIVRQKGNAQSALASLNQGLPPGTADDLIVAFPAFHYDDTEDHLFAMGQPNGDPFAVAADLAALAATSARHPTLRFELWLFDELHFAWEQGKIQDPQAGEAIAAFLKEVALAEAEPPLQGRRLEIAVSATWQTDPPALRAALEEHLGGTILEEGSGAFVPCIAALEVNVSSSGLRVAGVPAAQTAGRAAASMLSTIGVVLVGQEHADQLDVRVSLDGVEIGRAQDAYGLTLLAPLLGRRLRGG